MIGIDCIFCRIVQGKAFSHKVFDNKRILAFLDLHPLSKGHTLVIPKSHVARLEKLNFEDADALFKSIYELVSKIQDTVNAPSCTIAINNGVESGQEIPHVHVHIIPRFKNDGGRPIHVLLNNRPHLTFYQMREIARKIFD